jgi:hypothetical protein
MPSRLADEQEMRALVAAMAADGRGVYMLTRGQGTSIDFLESLAADSGRPVIVAATFYNGTNPDAANTTLAQTLAARERGHPVFAQVSCCPLTMDFTLRNPYVFEGLGAWKPAMAAHGEAVKRSMPTPGSGQQSRPSCATSAASASSTASGTGCTGESAGRECRAGGPLAGLAAERGVDPLDCMLTSA